jgi:predicted 3-demethylubiquinone-9 3-methyltransferase (glyoxalase superfamily)
MQKLTPFLWFNGNAEPAARFYTSIFKKSKIRTITRYGDAGPGRKGSVMTVVFRLAGQEFIALNGGPEFTFTEAISFVVNCATQKEIDWYWKKLSKGGKEIQCGWLKDKYGLCWQIVPTAIGTMLRSKHPEKINRVMKAVLGMVKLDLAALRRAYDA